MEIDHGKGPLFKRRLRGAQLGEFVAALFRDGEYREGGEDQLCSRKELGDRKLQHKWEALRANTPVLCEIIKDVGIECLHPKRRYSAVGGVKAANIKLE
jgi:hypothetical protein